MHHVKKDLLLRCNLCNWGKKSDDLWLRVIQKKDYLVCERHLSDRQAKELYDREHPNSK